MIRTATADAKAIASIHARSGFRLDGAKSTHEASGVATARMRLRL